ncbi:MAG: SDH family Clp fold serine proteinase [Chloroflexota bacterium]
MPTFQQYLDSIKDPKQHQQLRLKLIGDIEAYSNRKLIVYAADFKKAQRAPVIIDQTDKAGFSDLIEGIQGSPLDVFIHSPGGFAENTEELVKLLRANFDDIRFVVPHSAMSAATMFCLSGNKILMDDRSSLGPIDPQIQLPSQQGQISVPVQIIIDGFKKAKKAIADDPNALPVFLPWLNQYGLLVEVCQDAIDLSEALAKEWIATYMFPRRRNRKKLADKIASYLLSREAHKSHNRRIGIFEATKAGLNIFDMRQDMHLRDLIWQLYCCVELYFDRSASYKLFENNYGVSWARNIREIAVQVPLPGIPAPPQPLPEQPPPSP